MSAFADALSEWSARTMGTVLPEGGVMFAVENRNQKLADNSRLVVAAREFPSSLQKVWPYMFWGVALGVVCLIVGRLVVPVLDILKIEYMHSVSMPIARICHHLGIGFFVSSTAVLLYEWGAHYKEVLANGHRLTNAVDQILVKGASAALRGSLTQMFGRYDNEGSVLVDQIEAVCTSIESLYSHRNWSTDAYLQFVGVLLGKLSTNTTSLAKLNAQLSTRAVDGEPYHLDLPEGGFLASIVLAREMNALQQFGEYLVVSDIDSWAVLKSFDKAQEDAVARGAVIRRIFILDEPPSRKTSQVLYKHYATAEKWTRESKKGGKYAIRVLRNTEFLRLAPTLARIHHFGIFKDVHPDAPAVRFDVTENDLSKFSIVAIPRDHETIRQFEELWPRVAELTGYSRIEYLLKLEMKYLEKNGSYHVISDFHSWRDGNLASFHHETLEAIAKRDVTVQRVFVLRDGEDVAACKEILRDHYADMKRLSKHRKSYEFKMCSEQEARLAFGDERWLFGVFRSGGLEGDELRAILSEHTGPELSEFVLSPLIDQERAQQLDEFIRSVERVEVRARRDLGLELH